MYSIIFNFFWPSLYSFRSLACLDHFQFFLAKFVQFSFACLHELFAIGQMFALLCHVKFSRTKQLFQPLNIPRSPLDFTFLLGKKLPVLN